MTTLPSLRQLHYLVMLSEHLNFSRAAECCFVTQSTLSSGVKELEEMLGIQLVERDKKNVLMTPVGLDVVLRARNILTDARELVDMAAHSGKPMTGLLRLGVIPTIAPFWLPRCLPQFRKRHPDLQLALREDVTNNLLARLDDGRLDMALIALPYDTANLRVEPLFDEDLWLICRSGDSGLRNTPLELTPAITEQLLLLEEGHCLRDHALYACGRSAGPVKAGLEATSLLTLVQMVESGLGVGLIPEMALHSGFTESPNLSACRIAEPAPKRTIALVARRSSARIAEFKALAEVAHEAEGTQATRIG